MITPTSMQHLRSLLPDHLLFREDEDTRSMFSDLYSCYIHRDYESLVYPKGFNLESDQIPVCILFREMVQGEDTWFILQTHIDPNTEMLMSSESDSIRIYRNRTKDAFSYVARFSGVILA